MISEYGPTLLGGVIWGSGCVLLGWTFASALTQLGHYLTWAPLAVLAALGLVALLVHRSRPHEVDAAVDPIDSVLDASAQTAGSKR